MRITVLLAVLAAAAPTAATEVVRLSDAERDAVIAAAANGPEKAPVITPEQAGRQSVLDRSLYPEFLADGAGAAPDRRVHGEVSMFAGSGGTLGVSGSAVMPVGQTGAAAISLMRGTSRWGSVSGFGLGYAHGQARDGLLIGDGPGSLGLSPGMGGWRGHFSPGFALPHRWRGIR